MGFKIDLGVSSCSSSPAVLSYITLRFIRDHVLYAHSKGVCFDMTVQHPLLSSLSLFIELALLSQSLCIFSSINTVTTMMVVVTFLF